MSGELLDPALNWTCGFSPEGVPLAPLTVDAWMPTTSIRWTPPAGLPAEAEALAAAITYHKGDPS